MEKITYKNILQQLKSKMVLMVAGSFLLASCTTQMGGYTETDGVYYDPNRDTLPEGTVIQSGNQVGEYYDYQTNDNQNVYLNAENRNERWREAQESDWGSYLGTDTYYTDNWGSPFGFYGGFGFGMGYGWGSPWGWGSGFYHPWGFGYHPFYSFYSPLYDFYNPYFGFNSVWGYAPYGFYSPYGFGYAHNTYNGGFTYKRSGSDGSFRNSLRNANSNSRLANDVRAFRNNQANSSNNNSGFRNQNNSSNSNSGFRNQGNSSTRFRTQQPTRQMTPRQSTPDYSEPRFRSNSNSGYNGGGFRSGGSSSGSFGGSTSSGRSGGGFRR